MCNWMTLTMKILLTGLMLLCLSLPINAGEGPQQRTLDDLLDDMKIQQERLGNLPIDEQLRRLKSQLIDLRVERDRLRDENRYLRSQIDDLRNKIRASRTSSEPSVSCPVDECISIDKAEEQKILQHVIYTLSLYRVAELMKSALPESAVEAHREAHRIMKGAIKDLELLGFDTSNPDNFPKLGELLDSLDTFHESHSN